MASNIWRSLRRVSSRCPLTAALSGNCTPNKNRARRMKASRCKLSENLKMHYNFSRSRGLKEPGYFDLSHSRRGADSAPPLRSRKPIDETSSVWYYWIAMTLPSPLVPKKIKTCLAWRNSDVISDVMSKTRKSPKIPKIMVFAIFLSKSCIF